MRKELIEIEKIEQYLLKTMSKTERTEFEKQIGSNPDLKAKVEAQQTIMEAVGRMALKQSTKNAHKSFKLKALLTKLIVLMAIVATAGFITLQVLNAENSEKPTGISGNTSFLPRNDSISNFSNKMLEEEIFRISTQQDTVIENKDGVVIYIPANAFDTDNTEIDLLVQSALSAEDILYAGLSTTSNGDALETGGMFYVDAFENGKRINLVKDLQVDVPTDTKVDGMQLYAGEKTKDGDINWVNPAPLKNSLTPVDILTLDFFPPTYDVKLTDWGYPNKEFKDSLYYSFAFEDKEDVFEIPARPLTRDEAKLIYGKEDNRALDNSMSKEESEFLFGVNGNRRISYDEEIGTIFIGFLENNVHINPVSIKTIWNTKFNNTNLATKEFEERLVWIHKSCNQSVLDVYINNLDKPLYEVDLMVVDMVSGEVRSKFIEFSKRKDGKVELDDVATQKLSGYYKTKTKAYTKALLATQKTYWDEQAQKDVDQQKANTESVLRDIRNKEDVFNKELSINLCKVYSELKQNYDCNRKPIPPPKATYSVSVSSTGWNNIDKQVFFATLNRETTSISLNGKTSTLTYDNWIGSIAEHETYDRINVYNIPKTINSYVKIKGDKGKYTYKLNVDLEYETVVLAWNENQLYYTAKTTKKGEETFKLKAISEVDFKTKIKAKLGHINTMDVEIDYIINTRVNEKRVKGNMKRKKLRSRVEPIVFPCLSEITVSSDDPTVDSTSVELKLDD